MIQPAPDPSAALARPVMRLQRETVHIPSDTGVGGLHRPFARGDDGGRISTLETLYDFFIDDVPDPDEALALDPGFLRKLHMHWDVAAAMRKRELTVASMPDRVEQNPDAPDQHLAQQVAKYCSWAWEQLPGRHKLFQSMQRAVLAGGVGVEFDWHREATGVERPVAWHVIDKSRFLFDRRGRMSLRTRDNPVWGVRVPEAQASRFVRTFPPGKFVYHCHRQEPGTWEQPHLEGYTYFGVGEDVALYYIVTFDHFVMRFRLKWMEKYGMPPTLLYHPDNEAMTDDVRRIADSLRHESIVTIPKLMGQDAENDKNHFYAVEQLEVPTMTNDAFANFSKEWTKPKIDQLLLGAADEQQKSESGGYADHVSRQDSGPQIWYRWDATNISRTLTDQLIPAIARGRFPNLPPAYFPILTIEPKEERDRSQEMEIATSAAALVPIAEDEIYERCGFRKPKEGEPTVFTGGAMGAGDPFGMGLGGGPGAGMPPGGNRPGGPTEGGKPPGGPNAGPKGTPPTPATGGKPRAAMGQDGGKDSKGAAFNPLTSRAR